MPADVLPWSQHYPSKPGQLRELETASNAAVSADAPAPTIPKLFEPITIRNTVFKNRIIVPPMCQYSARVGYPTEYHHIHYGKLSMGGAGLIIVEATGVTLQGRISPFCLSFHEDGQIEHYKRIVDFAHSQGTLIGIQIGHAGRKASTPAPFSGRAPTILEGPDAWEVVGPSAIPYAAEWGIPHELTIQEIHQIQDEFVAATIRAEKAGFDMIEIHGAHGYLIHNFLSPVSNHRTDEYGGSFENRARFVLETVEKVRAAWSKPLFVRISATDFLEQGGWTVDDAVELSRKFKALGVDVVHVSAGGNISVRIDVKPGYQVPYSERVRNEAEIPTVAVGLITEPKQAEQILQEGKADFIGVARQHLRDYAFTFTAAKEFNLHPHFIPQYAWCIGK